MSEFPKQYCPGISGGPAGGDTLGSMVGDTLLLHQSTGLGTSALPTANQAYFFPINVYEKIVTSAIGWFNGGTVNAAKHIDVGIYQENGKRIVSNGGVTQGSASTYQQATFTTTTLMPGSYYLAFVTDDNTIFFEIHAINTVSAPRIYSAGLKIMTSAYPLPDPATFSDYVNNNIPMIALIV